MRIKRNLEDSDSHRALPRCPHRRPRCVVEMGAQSLKIHRLRGGGFHTVKHPYTLGHEVYSTGAVSELTADRIARTIRESVLPPAVVIGTSAVRDAANREDLVRLLGDRSRLAVRVLSTWEEAALVARGYLAQSRRLPALVADLGGGSLTLVFLNESRGILWDSLPVGAIRVYQQGVDDDLPETLECMEWKFREASIVRTEEIYATGGTAKAIARTLKRSTVTRAELMELEARVRSNGPPPGLKPHRSKVFHSGLLLTCKLLDFVGAERLSYLKISVGRVLLASVTRDGAGRLLGERGKRTPTSLVLPW